MLPKPTQNKSPKRSVH